LKCLFKGLVHPKMKMMLLMTMEKQKTLGLNLKYL